MILWCTIRKSYKSRNVLDIKVFEDIEDAKEHSKVMLPRFYGGQQVFINVARDVPELTGPFYVACYLDTPTICPDENALAGYIKKWHGSCVYVQRISKVLRKGEKPE